MSRYTIILCWLFWLSLHAKKDLTSRKFENNIVTELNSWDHNRKVKNIKHGNQFSHAMNKQKSNKEKIKAEGKFNNQRKNVEKSKTKIKTKRNERRRNNKSSTRKKIMKYNGKPLNNRKKKKNKKDKRRKRERNKRRKKKKAKKKGHPRDNLKFTASCECGITKKQRIVNGEESGAGDWPWMVTLETSSGGYYCGGSIISNRFVLTAAHCVGYKGEKVFVVIGDHDKTDDGETVTKRIKGRAVPHKNYNPGTMDNDVAVVRLNEAIDFSLYNGNVGPVCLAQKNSGDYDSDPVTVTGWGTLSSGGPQATVLMEVNLKTITNKKCGEDFMYEKEDIMDSMICTIAPDKDACQGDSGGPLVTLDQDSGRYVQIGVVSWGYGCAEKDYPGVFARVTRLERWILNQAKKIGEFCSEDD